MDAAELDAAIIRDRADGLLPAGIVASVGGTSIGGTDDVAAVGTVARKHGLYLHVDAAWAGAAMICPEFRHYWAGAELADSIVFNSPKWLGAQFDCSVQLVRDPESLVKTLAIRPEFLKTHGHDGIINYSEWTVPLGRRFRALKLWFLLRACGLEGLRAMIRNHVAWSGKLAERLGAHPEFEIVSQPILSLFSFRHHAPGGVDPDEHNLKLVNAINDDGRIYLTQTRVDGHVAIRFQAGQFELEEADIETAHRTITEIASVLS
jgi:aromatic-L-amino-acid decarboxylase